jgi:hypothetical protein
MNILQILIQILFRYLFNKIGSIININQYLFFSNDKHIYHDAEIITVFIPYGSYVFSSTGAEINKSQYSFLLCYKHKCMAEKLFTLQ